MFKLSGPLATPATLYNPTYSTSYGVPEKTWDKGTQIFCTFRTFGGTETTVNDLTTVENTAVIETWFRPDITSESKLVVNGKEYEVLGDPEDISMRHQYLQIKVRQIKGGA